jgi:hypothetical protein
LVQLLRLDGLEQVAVEAGRAAEPAVFLPAVAGCCGNTAGNRPDASARRRSR